MILFGQTGEQAGRFGQGRGAEERSGVWRLAVENMRKAAGDGSMQAASLRVEAGHGGKARQDGDGRHGQGASNAGRTDQDAEEDGHNHGGGKGTSPDEPGAGHGTPSCNGLCAFISWAACDGDHPRWSFATRCHP